MAASFVQVTETFPSVRIASPPGGLPVEVSLIAQLGHGSGNHLFASVVSRQQRHGSYLEDPDEPSAKLGGTHFASGDPTSLYSFVVGPKGHPFHRHAGHRVFTAISGSGGAQLRFSTASTPEITRDPRLFIQALRFVSIPPDCLFTVRFGGETWHQFAPLAPDAPHPVFFALSCHTNELGGNLSESLKAQVLAGAATIPALTETLPESVLALLRKIDLRNLAVPTTALALDAPEGTVHRMICNAVRGNAGLIRSAWGRLKRGPGFASHRNPAMTVETLDAVPEDSLLRRHLSGQRLHHEDAFRLRLADVHLKTANATSLLSAVLGGFLLNAPKGVSRLMAVRNLLVKPLGLRTSPLGCPVSSLLSDNESNLFDGRYPVLDQSADAGGTFAQVVLGADDKHLTFRSCISVKLTQGQGVDILLGNRVRCKNRFGRFYMAAIDKVHRRYIAPAMLRRAVDYALVQMSR